MTAWCTWCGDAFSPVEYAPVPISPFTPRFCSTACSEAFSAAEDASQAYEEAGLPAPLW